jgi:hypothetical protein
MAVHPNSMKNLRPFKPGQSGNPAGKPKGTALTDRLRKIVEQNEGEVAEALIKAAVKAALKGDFRFWQEIMNRMDGPIVVKNEHTGADGESLTVIIERSSASDSGPA